VTEGGFFNFFDEQIDLVLQSNLFPPPKICPNVVADTDLASLHQQINQALSRQQELLIRKSKQQ
jgi:hypothetical protein